MRLAYPKQNLLDWITQQWVILRGKQIDPEAESWLTGPFGGIHGIGDVFVEQLAAEEGLVVKRNCTAHGLIPSFRQLNLTDEDLANLSPLIIDFYEKTGIYQLGFSVTWNPAFRFFGILVNLLFSNRINQLNIPTRNTSQEKITSEIITLSEPATGTTKYTIWYRKSSATGRVIYSGIYTTCTLPSGKTCIKAIFPLPKGSATVIMSPSVTSNGGLHLDGSGKRFGDPGFYFLLQDSKGQYWSHYIRSFQDRLTLSNHEEHIIAEQIMTLWNLNVLRFNYDISFEGVSK